VVQKQRIFLTVLILLTILSVTISQSEHDQEKEKSIIRGLVSNIVDFRIDWFRIEIHDRWAFIDVARKDSEGDWISYKSVLARKTDGMWKIVAMGRPLDESWMQFYKRMTPEVRKAYDKWATGQI
jgi:hypothetical protein